MPSASVRTAAYRSSGANAINASRNVRFSVTMTSPAAFGTDLPGRELLAGTRVALAVLPVAPSPDLDRRLCQSRIETLLRRAGRQRNVAATAAKIRAALTS